MTVTSITLVRLGRLLNVFNNRDQLWLKSYGSLHLACKVILSHTGQLSPSETHYITVCVISSQDVSVMIKPSCCFTPYLEDARSDDSLHNNNVTWILLVERRYLRIFAHPPHHGNHHGDGDDHCQQSTNHDADYLARTQDLCGTERQEESTFQASVCF